MVLNGIVRQALTSGHLAHLVTLNTDGSPHVSLVWVGHYILPTLPAKVAELREMCLQADLLISVASQFAASIVAGLLRIPWVSVILTPSTLPSASIAVQPLPVPLPAPLQRLSNRFSWFVGGIFLRQIVDKPINKVRRMSHVPPRSHLMWTGNLSPRLTALAVSSAFVPRPGDWPAYVQMTGFCFWDRPTVDLPQFDGGSERGIYLSKKGKPIIYLIKN